MIFNSETTYDRMRYIGRDLEHWNGEQHVVSGFHSVIEMQGLSYEMYVDKIATDGLSVPSQFRDRIERYGWYLVAGLEHDCLYAGELFDRQLCDQIFFDKMEFKDLNRSGWMSRSIGWTLRNAAYYAVRLGGGSVWKGHTVDGVKEFRKVVWIRITGHTDNQLYNRIMDYEAKMRQAGYPPVILLT